MYKKVTLICFSGTGGAQRVSDAFQTALVRRGCEAVSLPLDVSVASNAFNSPDAAADSDLLILIYAVHAFDAPEPVYRWIDSATGAQRKVAILSVSGGGEVWPNTGCRVQCRKALEAKGFRVVYEKMMVMSCNWVFPTEDPLAMWLLKVLPEKVEKTLDSLFAGIERHPPGKMGAVRRVLTRMEKKNAHAFVKALRVGDRCNGCGWCSKNCPVGNIAMVRQRPEFLEACVMCFRCVYGCPRRAIETRHFMVIRQGFDLEALDKRMDGVPLPPVEAVARGLAWRGVRRYLSDPEDT